MNQANKLHIINFYLSKKNLNIGPVDKCKHYVLDDFEENNYKNYIFKYLDNIASFDCTICGNSFYTASWVISFFTGEMKR